MTTLVTIGDFARMTFLSVKALRHYHELGLLTPAQIDTATGYRRYAVSQVATAQAIRRLRELGMPLDEVRAVIDADDVAVRNRALSAHLRRMEGELERTRATVASLRMLLDESPPPTLRVSYAAVPASDALAIQDRVASADMFDWLDAALRELRDTEQRGAVDRVGPDAALYSNELLEDEYGEIVALLPGASTGATAARVEIIHLPRVEYAIAVHDGPVSEIDRTYAALGAVVAERAIGVQGPIRENYLVGAFDDPDESTHRTEVCWPVFQTASDS